MSPLQRLAWGRLAMVLAGAFLAAAGPAFSSVWSAAHLAPDATFGDVQRLTERASVAALQAGVPALVGAVVAFLVRADKTLPAFALRGTDAQEMPVVAEVPKEWVPVTTSATVSRPSPQELEAALEVIRRATGDKTHG